MNGYGTDQQFLDWLTFYGLKLPEDAPSPAVLRAIGSTYVDSAYAHALGCSTKTGGFSQELEWPRTGHKHNGLAVPNDFIPPQWVQAAYRAGYLEATTPGWSTGTVNPDRQTRREKVDVIEREYFAAADSQQSNVAAGMTADALINGMVLPWLCAAPARTGDSLFRVI